MHVAEKLLFFALFKVTELHFTGEMPVDAAYQNYLN